MRKPEIRNTKIVALERTKNSINGNPRYRVALDVGRIYLTVPDANCAYGIENPELRGQVDVWLNGRGMIEFIQPAVID